MARIKSGSINQVFQWELDVDETLESTSTVFLPVTGTATSPITSTTAIMKENLL